MYGSIYLYIYSAKFYVKKKDRAAVLLSNEVKDETFKMAQSGGKILKSGHWNQDQQLVVSEAP